MGFKLMENFDRPYLSRVDQRVLVAVAHLAVDAGSAITSTSRSAAIVSRAPRWYYNLFIMFLLSGLWHGANWTFVIWGALNGFYLISSLATRTVRERIASMTGLMRYPPVHAVLRILVTFALTCFAWCFSGLAH